MAEPARNESSFAYRVFIATAIVVGVISLVYFFWQAAYVLLLVFAGVLLAIFLRGLAEGLQRVWARLPMKAALAIVIVVLLAISAITIWLLAPSVAEQVDELGKQLPQAVKNLKDKAATYPAVQRAMNSATWQRLFDPHGSTIVTRAAKFATGAINAVLAAVLVIFIGFYFAFDPRVYTNGLLRLIPREKRQRGAEILGSIGYTLRWWMIAQFIDMWIIGIATAIGLWMLGVKLALVFGILAGLFNIIPNFGPLISLIPATLIALMDSPQTAINVIILYMVMQTLEGYLLLPLLQRKAVDVPPVITIAAQVIMGLLMGAIGLLLAAPLTAAVFVLVKMLYVEETLGDDIETPEDHIVQKDIPPVPGRRRKVKT